MKLTRLHWFGIAAVIGATLVSIVAADRKHHRRLEALCAGIEALTAGLPDEHRGEAIRLERDCMALLGSD